MNCIELNIQPCPSCSYHNENIHNENWSYSYDECWSVWYIKYFNNNPKEEIKKYFMNTIRELNGKALNDVVFVMKNLCEKFYPDCVEMFNKLLLLK